jgi:hypothetical protein
MGCKDFLWLKKKKKKKNEIKSKGGKYEKLERNRGMS